MTNDSFDLGGGGGNTFSFGPQGTQPGASVTGTVLDMKEVQKTKYGTSDLEYWDNGDPKMQYRVTLQTELRTDANDDGQRNLYLDGKRKPFDDGNKSRLCAVLDAVRDATGGTKLQRGATLTVTWVGGMGFSGDPRHYTASYTPPAMDLGNETSEPAPGLPQPNTSAETPQAAQQPAATAGGNAVTPEQVAAVKAAGLDPSVVFAGQQLPASA